MVLNPNIQAGEKFPFCLPALRTPIRSLTILYQVPQTRPARLMKRRSRIWLIITISQILASLASNVQLKSILAMMFDEIKFLFRSGGRGMHPPCVRAWSADYRV